MDFDEIITTLKVSGWRALNKSLTYRNFGEWQVSLVRLGGRFQQPNSVAFVVCVRHTSLRNLNEERVNVEKEPYAYPFKLTLDEILHGQFQYQSKLLNYEHSRLPIDADWSSLLLGLEETIPKWLSSFTPAILAKQISKLGQAGYVECLWLEDLK